MFFFIHHFTIQDFKGVEVNALMKGENGVADSGVIGQAEVLL